MRRWMGAVFGVLLAAFALLIGWLLLAAQGSLGSRDAAGEISRSRRSAPEPRVEGSSQILFGDLHVHTTYSFDAFSISLPMFQGEGSHPPADACDFARFCSALDFWSINDHAEGLTPYQWAETKDMVRECNAVAGDPADPDMVTFLGWEWTQIGQTPDDHYGHKNVVLRDTAEGAIPARPISSRLTLFPGDNDPYPLPMRLLLSATAPGGQGREPYYDFMRFLADRRDFPACPSGVPVRDLPSDCQESAPTPTDLFAKLEDWGHPHLVIPHGNTWGFYTPPGATWDKQLRALDDPERQEFLLEVFSGHGSIESYRPWTAVEFDAQGHPSCPQPSPGYTPECWRAGEIVHERCSEAGESEPECARRAAQARAHHVAAGAAGHLTVPGTRVEDWLDAGQCTDCYMPAYDYRPGGSAQYALARQISGEDGEARRYRFGFLGSSDVHTARPGTGYKEFARRKMTDAGLGGLGPPASLNAREPEPRSIPLAEVTAPTPYFERFASFFGAGGLVAVHSEGRDRESIWDALSNKRVYATSGDRIQLWFDRIAPGGARDPMGSSVESGATPIFEVRAVGAFEQKPGCPPEHVAALGPERLERLCAGECYHPSDQRRRIERIEVVRIRPQRRDDEPLAELIDDPWKVIPCHPDRSGCRVQFGDSDYVRAGRDTVYYVRAIQEPTPTVNGENLRCERNERGECIRVAPCSVSDATDSDDDCLSEVSERAWSSPIFMDFPPLPSVGASS